MFNFGSQYGSEQSWIKTIWRTGHSSVARGICIDLLSLPRSMTHTLKCKNQKMPTLVQNGYFALPDSPENESWIFCFTQITYNCVEEEPLVLLVQNLCCWQNFSWENLCAHKAPHPVYSPKITALMRLQISIGASLTCVWDGGWPTVPWCILPYTHFHIRAFIFWWIV